MPEVEKVQKLIAHYWPLVPFSIVLLVVVVLIALHLYPKLKVFIGDVLRPIGWFSKWFRKRSIESQLEGTINSFTKDFNSEMSRDLLPECSVEWVGQENVGVIVKEGRPLVRVSFQGDYDQTFYNAANLFVKRLLIAKAKPFLRQLTSDAIDLLMVQRLLKKTRRNALALFNQEFRSQQEELRDLFLRMQDAEASGLFKRVFLQELYFLGESLGTTVPSRAIEDECERFWEWFYGLATRESEHQVDLSFSGQHLKVGIILVASPATYQKHGKDPYIRRAHIYASKGFNCVYLLARGKQSGGIVLDVLKELTHDEEFEIQTRETQIEIDGTGDQGRFLLTCVCLRPIPAVIKHNAWEKLRNALGQDLPVAATIIDVEDSCVTVDVYGIHSRIPAQRLSSLPKLKVERHFFRYDELLVKVLECNQDNGILRLSNEGTETDPATVVEKFANCYDTPVNAVVRKIIGSGPEEYGISIEFPGTEYRGYIHRSKATPSRFKRLSELYAPGYGIIVTIETYSPEHKNFVCCMSALVDPWSRVDNYSENDIVSAVVCQISQRSVVCELEEGLEAVIPFRELAWGEESDKTSILRALKVGETISAKVLAIDAQSRRITLSLSRVVCSPTEQFFRNHENAILTGTVSRVDQRYALMEIVSSSVMGYLPVSEFMHSYCADLTRHLTTGDEVGVKCISYAPERDMILLSVKQVSLHQFEDFIAKYSAGDEIRGLAKRIDSYRVILELTMDEISVEGYVHLSQVSACAYLDESDMLKLLERGREYSFLVKRIDERFSMIEVSRKLFFQQNLPEIAYGEEYVGIYFRDARGCDVVYGDRFEGYLTGIHGKALSLGQEIRVIPARIDLDRKRIEFALTVE